MGGRPPFLIRGEDMAFAVGRLERVIQGQKATFNGYDIAGDLLVDVKGKRGWLIKIIYGIEHGTFSVVDGEIHRSGIQNPSTVEDSIDILTEPREVDLIKLTKQAISDAIAKWEEEELEKTVSL